MLWKKRVCWRTLIWFCWQWMRLWIKGDCALACTLLPYNRLSILLTVMMWACSLILETDPPTIASRVSMRGAESDIPLTDRVSEVGLTLPVRHHSVQILRRWYGTAAWQSCHIAVGQYTIFLGDGKGAAGKVPAEVRCHSLFIDTTRW